MICSQYVSDTTVLFNRKERSSVPLLLKMYSSTHSVQIKVRTFWQMQFDDSVHTSKLQSF